MLNMTTEMVSVPVVFSVSYDGEQPDGREIALARLREMLEDDNGAIPLSSTGSRYNIRRLFPEGQYDGILPGEIFLVGDSLRD